MRTDSHGAVWGAFLARKSGEERFVREQVRDTGGRTWSDVTAWYWASITGSASGPGWVTTVVQRHR